MEIRVDCVILQRYIPSSIFWSGHSDSFWFCFRWLNVLNWLQPRSIRVQHRNPMHGIKWFPIHTSRIWPKLHGARWTNVFHAAHFRIYPLLDFWGSDCSIWNLDILISLSRNWISRTFHLSFLEWKVYVYVFFFRKYRKNFDGTDGNTRMMDLSNTLFSSRRKMGRLFSLFLLEFVWE